MTYPSKGAARRAAGDYSTPEITAEWQRKLMAGLAGEHPLVSFVDNRDGRVYTDHFAESQPPSYPRLSWWQRTIRALTPQRWRKPLRPIRNDPLARQQRMLEGIVASLEKLGQ
jgi:hypothetical protein